MLIGNKAMTQKLLNISSISHDDSNQTLDKLQVYLDFDLNLLSKEQKDLIFKLIKERKKAIKNIENFQKFINTFTETGIFYKNDLKLHDVNWHIWENESIYSKYNQAEIFNRFCLQSFDDYQVSLREKTGYEHHDLIDQIGRSSSFNFKDACIESFLEDWINDNQDAHSDVFDFSMGYHYNDINDLNTNLDCNILEIEDILESLLYERTDGDHDYLIDRFNDSMTEILNDLGNTALLTRDYKDHAKDAIIANDYIRSFKANQVEYFVEWFEYEKEFLEEI